MLYQTGKQVKHLHLWQNLRGVLEFKGAVGGTKEIGIG